MRKKIRMEESPYTFVRAKVMKSLLIPRSEYKKLLGMSISEIARYLSETQYRDDINELGVDFSGLALIEQALNRNFSRMVEKLRRISHHSYNQVIDAYLLKYDIENIKTLLRAKQAGTSEDDAMKLMMPAGKLSSKQLRLIFKKNQAEILEAFEGTDAKSLTEVETNLDHYYFSSMLDFADKVPRQGKLLKEFILNNVHTANVLTFLRLKRLGMENKQIEKHIFFTPKYSFFYRHLLQAKRGEESQKMIRQHFPINSFDSLTDVEISLQKYLVSHSNFEHQNPLSVYIILEFLMSKEIELKNLKRIISAKHLGMDMSLVEPMVVA